MGEEIERIGLHRCNGTRFNPPLFMDREAGEQSSKVGSIWRIRDVSEGPMTHTLFTRLLSLPRVKSRWSSRAGRETWNRQRKKLITTFFPPRIDRPKSNISTPPKKIHPYPCLARQGIEYTSWHDYQRHRRHCNPNFWKNRRGEVQKSRTTFHRWEKERKEEIEMDDDGMNVGWAWWKSCVKLGEIRLSPVHDSKLLLR